MARILVIEDDDQLNVTLCEVLRKTEQTVRAVKSKEEALRALADDEYDLILTNTASGHQLARIADAYETKLLLIRR